MQQQFLNDLKKWFDSYVAGFYGYSEFIDANIHLKEEHSEMVCREMEYIVDHLDMTENQRRIAKTVALLHDVGRFEQFLKYQTYNDPRSINHSQLGVEIIDKVGVLEPLENVECDLIRTAIKWHGAKELPPSLNADELLYARLIRDADKLDIFRVVTDYLKQYREDPDNFKLEVELPDQPGYSDHVVQLIMEEKTVDYSVLRTWNDMKILQLGWVYDINFNASLKRLYERRLLDLVLEFLPDDDVIRKVKNKVFSYVESRIKSNCPAASRT